MNHQALEQKRRIVNQKTIIGIDPAKVKHQAAIIDASGMQRGASFAFPVSVEGYTIILWKNIHKILPTCNADEVVFAVESSCNLWHTITYYLHSLGYTVLLVSPLSTHHARPILNLEFSRTDPKDAFLVARLAQQGSFQIYTRWSPESNALHALGIAYDKLRKNMAQNRARLRALMERVFPEFLTVLPPDTDSAMYLLKRYCFPDEFLALDCETEAKALERISRQQHGRMTLERLRIVAKHSIGIPMREDERIAERVILSGWIAMIETVDTQMIKLLHELLRLAEQIPEFHILTSIKGIGDTLAALFLAEVRSLKRFTHFKQLEKLAALNLRLSDSGQHTGIRHISHLGNKRLLWIVYKMTEETARRVPEVRCKYLTRQLHRRRHRKSVIAATPQLLQLIVALTREQRPYQMREAGCEKLKELEQQYTQQKHLTANRRASRLISVPAL